MKLAIQTYLPPAPPLMLATGLVLWGWQTSQLALSVIMTLLLEGHRFKRLRIDLDSSDLNRITDYTSVLMVIVIIYMFYNYGSPGIFEILASLPMVLFPLILAQLYSTRGALDTSNLFVSLRKLKSVDQYYVDNRINIAIPYFIICVISASEGNRYPELFFTTICLLTFWLLWIFRPGRYALLTWLLILGLATITGFTVQNGLRNLQARLEASFIEFFYRFHSSARDSNRQTTAIGSIGRLKLSDRIVLRLAPPERLARPLYLSEASYNYYAYGTWTNIEREPQLIDPEINGTSWILQRPDTGKSTARITAWHGEDEVILPVPQGTTGIHQLSAFQMQRENTDSIKVELEPGWNSWNVRYHADAIASPAPVSGDVHVGQTYREDLHQLAVELGLYNKTRPEIIDTVERFFQDNFRYSLVQKRRYPRGKYLTKFLFENRQGHCEYFATATTLLLRTAGIPTRYVVGYVVDEYSNFEGQYVARSRHAHSWVMARVNGRWIRVDTTPAIWAELENENRSSLQFFSDAWSWMRLGTNRLLNSCLVLWLDADLVIAALFMFLVIKIYLRKKSEARQTSTAATAPGRSNLKGMDSPLYAYIGKLESLGHQRQPGETLEAWFRRLSERIPGIYHAGLIHRHYQYRFDPETAVTREQLEQEIRNTLPEPTGA